MAKEKVVKLDNGPLKEPIVDVPVKEGKAHVDIYLKSKGVPLWERGGKRAFAKVKDKLYATDKEFDELFKNY